MSPSTGSVRRESRSSLARSRGGNHVSPTGPLLSEAAFAGGTSRFPPAPPPSSAGDRPMRLRIGHLYREYLNIYADRGNIAVLARRAAWRGFDLEVTPLGLGEALRPGEHDLIYIGG